MSGFRAPCVFISKAESYDITDNNGNGNSTDKMITTCVHNVCTQIHVYASAFIQILTACTYTSSKVCLLSPNNRMRRGCLSSRGSVLSGASPAALAARWAWGVALWWPCVVEVARLLACVRKASHLAGGGRPGGHIERGRETSVRTMTLYCNSVSLLSLTCKRDNRLARANARRKCALLKIGSKGWSRCCTWRLSCFVYCPTISVSLLCRQLCDTMVDLLFFLFLSQAFLQDNH